MSNVLKLHQESEKKTSSLFPKLHLPERNVLAAPSKRVFKYTALDKEKIEKSGEVTATSFAEASHLLRLEELDVEKLSEKKEWWSFEIGSSIPATDVLQFTRQLASFAEAGIPISRGIKVLSTATDNKKLRNALVDIGSEIEGGGTLSEAIQHQGKVFPSYFVPILTAAERTGSIADALVTLNEYLERDVRSKRAVKSALSYPIVLAVLSLVAITVLSLIVLPRFEIFFQSLNVKLPLPTRMLLWVTRFFQSWWWLILLLSIAGVIVYQVGNKNPKVKLQLDTLKLKTPVLGGMAQLVAVERFCRILETLVRSKVPLTDALLLAGKSTSNRVFEEAVIGAQSAVLKGEGLAKPLSQNKCFPTVAIHILQVGEESGQLDAQLSQASSFYSDELDFKMKNFTSLIEPVVLIVLGGAIGFVAVALISAMYGIYSGVQG